MRKMIEIGGYEIQKEDWESTPASARELVGKLVKENEELRARVRQLEERLNQLEERINQNSKNSSRPPSQDKLGEKGENRGKASGRKRGGQKGHKGQERNLYETQECRSIEEVKPEVCGHCGGKLRGEDAEPYRHQVVEIPRVKAEIREYRLHQLKCENCGKKTRAKLPKGVTQKGYGERLSGLVGLLSGRHHQSHGLVQELLTEVFGVSI